MIMKWLKRSVIVAAGVSLVGGMLFGKDVVSYVRSSAKSVQTVVKDSVPIEFELRRAREHHQCTDCRRCKGVVLERGVRCA